MTYGQKADLFSTFRPFSLEERELLKQSILWTYDKFLTTAVEGRNLTREDVDKVGRGRVWTGRQALAVKLVDELGGLDKALDLAKSLAGIPPDEDVRLVVWPRRTSLLGTIFGRQQTKADLLPSSELGKWLQALRVLQKENPWAVMPFWLSIR